MLIAIGSSPSASITWSVDVIVVPTIVRPLRHVAMYLMRQKTQASLADVGRELGGRDHSTVLNGCDRIQSESQSDVQLRRDLDAIEDLLRQTARQ